MAVWKAPCNLAQPVLQDVGEADQDRQVDAAQHQRIDQFLEVDGAGGVLFRVDADVAVLAHREVALAPARDVVEVAGQLGAPSLGGLHDQGAFAAVSSPILPLLWPSDFSFLRNEGPWQEEKAGFDRRRGAAGKVD